ncbi:LamG-like jellyroll fold domain-containing protein [Olleya aquimaris]|uniref:Putative secreted protein (Por secretion system target) n=1 Tax=Olleya aquimaris TaxID=639310 RepID=A0A327R7Q7_9FLAO|nr:LamG-like jellyroll fold domain-containing protein [Olleya aquimaris]RAJ12148.1 putative secreted protein (Por secretion system target) [Olleya aquimaris]
MNLKLLILTASLFVLHQTTFSQCSLTGNDIACDDFSSNNNSGGSGWSGNWLTSGSPSFTGGQVFMNGGSNRIIGRQVNLTGYDNATLTFTWRCVDSSSGFESGDFIDVAISTDGGASFSTTLFTRNGDQICPSSNNSESGTITVPITTSGGANTILRFRSATNSGSEDIYWDDIIVKATVNADPCDAVASGNLDTDGDGISDICDVDDDNDGILDVDECSDLGKQPLLDPDFEDVDILTLDGVAGVDVTGTSGLWKGDASYIPDWESADMTNNHLEIWHNTQQASNDSGGQAFSGEQWAEVNATTNDGLYQDIATTPGDVLNWSFAHRKRTGFAGSAQEDIVRLLIGDANGTLTSQGVFSSASDASWTEHSGIYVVPAGQTTTRLTFEAISVASGSSSTTSGNFVDKVQLYVSPNCEDEDADGLPDYLDLDSDNDGIPDNVEAQSTLGYIAPSGTVNTSGPYIGLWDNYGTGLTVEDTDGDGTPDFRDSDSDNDGLLDIEENGMIANSITLFSDSDNDGLDNLFEGSNLVDFNDVNDEINNPSSSVLPDTDSDLYSGGDLDYRDYFNVNPPYSATLDFDGIDDYAEVNSTINGLSEYTVSLWFKYNGPTLNNSEEVFVMGQKDVFEITIKNWASPYNPTYNGINSKAFYNNSEFSGVSTGWRFKRSDWTNVTVAVRQNGGKVETKIYRNGFASSNWASLTGTLSTNSEPLRLGIVSGVNDFDYNFEGWMDEVRVFDKALTSDQIQRMVFQEIESNAGNVYGSVISKDIIDISNGTKIPWNNLVSYYPMTNIVSSRALDYSNNNNPLMLYNITSVLEQTAPMPFETVSDGDWTQESTWLHGDVWDIENLPVFTPSSQSPEAWSIVKIHNNVTTSRSHKGIGLFIDQDKSLTVNGTNSIDNSWYLELNGTLNLKNDSQLIQGINSDLVTSSEGRILRGQEGQSSVYRYNYWGSPVGQKTATTLLNNNGSTNNPNNTAFILDQLKDASNNNVLFTSALHEDGKISNYWLYNYQNGVTYYDWGVLNTSTPLLSGTGYTQKGGGSLSEYIFDGKPNNGTILLSATDTGGSGSVGGSSKTEYLLGNPYPSALDANQFILDNSSVISGEIYLWEQWAGDSHILNAYEGGYATLNLLGGVKAYQFVGLNGANNGSQDGLKTPTRYLPVAQGFMVEVANDGEIVFNNNQRVFKTEASGDSIFFKTQNTQEQSEPELAEAIQKIRLEFKTSNNLGRELLLGFSSITTDGFDYGYDAKVYETSVNDLTMPLNNDKTVIQAFSSITSDKVIDLNFIADGLTTYSIKAIALENIESTQEVYLLDNLTGVYHNLNGNQEYNFTSEAGEYNDRFDLVFQNKSAVLGVDNFETDNSLIYYSTSQETLFVKGLKTEAKVVKLYNALGQEVYNNVSITNQQLENGLKFSNLSTGLYIVSIKTENNQTIDKKIIIE